MRSLATRQSNLALSCYDAIQVIKAAKYDIILETSELASLILKLWTTDVVSLYVMTPEFGAATQLEKSTCLILLI
jgi:putative protein kinase ArgK-like GTPase of G3E family